jgi:hypothetical protein
MKCAMKLRYFMLWLPMILIAFTNAALREILIVTYFNELRAHQFSTLLLIILCGGYTWLILPQLKINSSTQAMLVGLIWMILTVVFEFTLGLLTGKTWDFMFRNYDITAGHLWPFFLLSILFLPYLLNSLKLNRKTNRVNPGY